MSADLSGMLRAFFLFYLAVWASMAYAQAHSTIDLAAWNLGGFNAIPIDKRKEQAKVVAVMDAEVLGLVEINPDSALDTIISELNALGVCYDKIILSQSASQNVGVLAKCGILMTNARFIPGSNLGNPGLRQALAVDIKAGGFDFTIIVLHLKAGRDPTAHVTRDDQSRVIGAFIESEDPNEREDFVVLGDYNMIPGQDVSNFHLMSPNDRLNFISSWDLEGRFTHLKLSTSPNLLDGFAISRKRSGEYIIGSLRVYRADRALGMSLESFRTQISDHLPFMASFRTDRDRD